MQPPRFDFCQYFGFVFLSYCVVPRNQITQNYVQRSVSNSFVTDYEWSSVNFTWPSRSAYEEALQNGVYIPEHNALIGIKVYKDRMYLALPRLRPGTPITLASVPINHQDDINEVGEVPIKRNLLLDPFPSWDMNVKTSCTTLQNVQSMEIDRRGIMWILDGTRINDFTKCPPKLVLIDLNNNRIVSRHIFTPDIALTEGGFLNDLVIDESDGGYAYITDNSALDPGLIVYSRKQKRAWKLRDRSMFPELDATNFTIDGVRFGALAPIDGIALSPLNPRRNEERIVYYTALSGYNLYAISNRILRNERFCKGDQWRAYVKHVGRKPAITDGMIIDNKGNLFYGLIQSHGIGKWNIYEYFNTAREVVSNSREIIWPDSFAMDNSGYLYVLCNGIHKYFDQGHRLTVSDEVKFRVLKLYTGNKNYMYSP